MYGPKGSVNAGRITPETESAVLLKYMWIYTKKCSWLGKAEYRKSKTWHVYSSENHHAMDFTCHWHFSKYAKDLPEYKDLKCDDGATLSEHYKAWNAYIIEYCRERARKGLCVEMRSDGYNSTLIKGFYNFYDFGDERLKKAAGMFLDLYFAYWAEEQIMGHMGGGASRIKGNNAFTQNRKHGNAVLAWLYFAIGKQPELNGHDVGALTSSYRPPAVVADIALDTEGRGTYEIRQRVQGLGKQGHTFPHMDRPDQRPNKFRTDGGGILRYSYCTPNFILGTPMTEARPFSDWVMISSQSRWQGVIFEGDGDPRIVPVPRAKNNLVCFNQFWSVQSKGCLITQKLKTGKDVAEMIIWMSKKGLPNPVDEDGIVFVEAPGAYAAVRVGKGTYKLEDKVFNYTKENTKKRTTPPGWVMTPENEYTPVILEVMGKTEVDSFDAFKTKVKGCKPKYQGEVLTYQSIYGDKLTLDTSYKQTPTINGEPVNYKPKKVFNSPFLNADYDSGVVTIRKGIRKKVLDFNIKKKEEKEKTMDKTNHNDKGFEKADKADWKMVFSDDCTDEWKKKWFLDGEIGTVKTGKEGMTLTAGPEFKNDAHHMVLWTKDSFKGDLKIEYDYTREDDENRCVNIIYIQATGSGKKGFEKDITKWNDKRKVPAMRTYFNNMNTYHISYAAFGNDGKATKSYIRGRRYMPNGKGLKSTELEPEYWSETLFAKGVKHHITIIKKDREIYMKVENPYETAYFFLENKKFPVITEGRIGLRHMFTRSATYKDFKVSVPNK
jgi:hypothetical protein